MRAILTTCSIASVAVFALTGLNCAGGAGAEPGESGDPNASERTLESQQATQTCVTIQRGVFGNVADTQIASNVDVSHPSGNFGAGPAAIAGTVGPGHRKALFSFDLSFIPTGSTLNSATMTLNARSTSQGGPGNTLSVYAVTSAWAENTVNWASAPTYNASSVASDSGGPGAHTFDVTSLATGWLRGGNHGVMLDQDAFFDTNFFTSENGLASNRPSLAVCYTTLSDPTNCKTLHDTGSASDGIYTINPSGAAPFSAYCDMTNGGWTLVGRELANNQSTFRYLGVTVGTPNALAAGGSDALIGNMLQDQYKSFKVVGAGNNYQVDPSADVFVNTQSLFLAVSNFSSTDSALNSLVSSAGGLTLCRAAVATSIRPGDTSWGLIPLDSPQRSCGCNSGGWAGHGAYYGGTPNGQQTVCTGWGGSWAGTKQNGQQKGTIFQSTETTLWVK